MKRIITLVLILCLVAQLPYIKIEANISGTPLVSSRVCYTDANGYMVEATVNPEYTVAKVSFPSWTADKGQDDIIWYSATTAWHFNNKYYYYIPRSDHNGEWGPYCTHAYGYKTSSDADMYSKTTTTSNSILLKNQVKPCGVTYYNNHLYTAFNEPYTWAEAKAFCESCGSYLACITSQEENDAVTGILGGNLMYFLGGQRVSTSTNEFSWITGESFDYSNMHSAQPDNYAGSETKLHIFSQYYQDGAAGYWGDIGEGKNYKCGFVMETDLSDNFAQPVITKEYDGHTYQLFDIKLPWHTAKLMSEIKGGHLMTINSLAEYTSIIEIVSEYTKPTEVLRFFLGSTDEDREGEFQWITGEEYRKSSMLWHNASQPDNGNGQGQDYLTVQSSNYLIDDYGCTGGKCGFIMEIEPDETEEDTAATTTDNESAGDTTATIVKKESSASNKAKVGSTFKKGNLKYKITKIKGTSGKVTVVGVKSKKLKKVTIPSVINRAGVSYQITAIGTKAFMNCKKLKTITIKSKKIAKMGKQAFRGVNKKVKFLVPKSKRKKYAKMIKKAW